MLFSFIPEGQVEDITGLHPQSPRRFARQLSARVSQILWPSYVSHMTAAAT